MTYPSTQSAKQDGRPWWWCFALPAAVVLLAILWSAVMLGRIQEASGERLYALFAYTDSAGTGEILWKKDGQAQAFGAVKLPYYVGLSLVILATVAGGIGVRNKTGCFGLVGFCLYGLTCAAVLSAVFGWLWVNVIGVFI